MKQQETLDLERRIKMEALISEREGYIALNKQREATGNSMGYSEDVFFENAEKIRALLFDDKEEKKG